MHIYCLSDGDVNWSENIMKTQLHGGNRLIPTYSTSSVSSGHKGTFSVATTHHPPALTTGWSCRAWQAAFTKGDMKPSLTPCFLRKASLNWLRMPMTLLRACTRGQGSQKVNVNSSMDMTNEMSTSSAPSHPED